MNTKAAIRMARICIAAAMTMITATATRQGTTTIMTMAAACYVKLRSNRTDLRAEYLDPFAGIEKIRLRGGLTDYQHQEIEGGEVGTTFKNRGYDLRLEAQHKPIAGWRGVVGMQTSHSDFRADGEEAFLPRSKTRANGIFLLEEYKLADWRFELGARQDWQTVSPGRRAAQQPVGHLAVGGGHLELRAGVFGRTVAVALAAPADRAGALRQGRAPGHQHL